MLRHPLFIFLFSLLIVIATLHLVALEFFLYRLYPWFDIMMHFLGGIFISLSALWFFFESEFVSLKKTYTRVFLTAIVSIVAIGVGWEIFEVVAGIPIEENFILDTTVDLAMDIVGMLAGFFVFSRLYLKEEKNIKIYE